MSQTEFKIETVKNLRGATAHAVLSKSRDTDLFLNFFKFSVSKIVSYI